MKIWVTIGLLAVSNLAIAADLSGTWKAWPAGEANGQQHEILFDLTATGNALSGTAYLGEYAQMGQNRAARIGDGKVEGDRFSFRVYDTVFEGAVTGMQLRLTAGLLDLQGERVESKVTSPVSTSATAEDVSGTWKAWFVGPVGPRPKMFSEVVFTLHVTGDQVTGNAHMGSWPGDAPISDGHYEAGHFAFTATGRVPSSGGIPKFRFEGTIHGDEMKVAMTGISEGPNPGGHDLPMDGKKLK